MSDTTKDEGYKDGQAGATAEDNPHDNSGVLDRIFDITTDVVTGNIGNTLQTNDQNSSDWQEGQAAGEADRKNNE